MPMSKESIYKVVFMNQGEIYEVYARSVGHGSLFGSARRAWQLES